MRSRFSCRTAAAALFTATLLFPLLPHAVSTADTPPGIGAPESLRSDLASAGPDLWVKPNPKFVAQRVDAPTTRPIKAMIEREESAESRRAYLAARQELLDKLGSFSPSDHSPEKLVVLRDLCRSYLGMPITRYGRDEEAAYRVIQDIQKAYSKHELQALMLQYDLFASTRQSRDSFDHVLFALEACFNILTAPPGSISDSTRNVSAEDLGRTIATLRDDAEERIKRLILSHPNDRPFMLTQLQRICDELPEQHSLAGWAVEKLEELEAAAIEDGQTESEQSKGDLNHERE